MNHKKQHFVFKGYYACKACQKRIVRTFSKKPIPTVIKCPYCKGFALMTKSLEGFLEKRTNKIRLFRQKLLIDDT